MEYKLYSSPPIENYQRTARRESSSVMSTCLIYARSWVFDAQHYQNEEERGVGRQRGKGKRRGTGGGVRREKEKKTPIYILHGRVSETLC